MIVEKFSRPFLPFTPAGVLISILESSSKSKKFPEKPPCWTLFEIIKSGTNVVLITAFNKSALNSVLVEFIR
jgi:hypothetical protein